MKIRNTFWIEIGLLAIAGILFLMCCNGWIRPIGGFALVLIILLGKFALVRCDSYIKHATWHAYRNQLYRAISSDWNHTDLPEAYYHEHTTDPNTEDSPCDPPIHSWNHHRQSANILPRSLPDPRRPLSLPRHAITDSSSPKIYKNISQTRVGGVRHARDSRSFQRG